MPELAFAFALTAIVTPVSIILGVCLLIYQARDVEKVKREKPGKSAIVDDKLN